MDHSFIDLSIQTKNYSEIIYDQDFVKLSNSLYNQCQGFR
jgi:hypothetical protein